MEIHEIFPHFYNAIFLYLKFLFQCIFKLCNMYALVLKYTLTWWGICFIVFMTSFNVMARMRRRRIYYANWCEPIGLVYPIPHLAIYFSKRRKEDSMLKGRTNVVKLFSHISSKRLFHDTLICIYKSRVKGRYDMIFNFCALLWQQNWKTPHRKLNHNTRPFDFYFLLGKAVSSQTIHVT